MLIYRKVHEMILLILLIGILNIYDMLKNVNISILDIIQINEKNILYLFLITLFFFFIFFHSNLESKDFSLVFSMEFELILGLGLIGLYFILLSNDLLLFYLALELYSLSVYLLLFKNEIDKAKISILYFLLGSISSSFILLGIAILYNKSGSLDFYFILQNLDLISNYHKEGGIYVILGLILIILGILFKLGAAPFQYWVIRVYTQMDLKILVYQSIVPKIVYILLLSNIIYNINSFNINLVLLLLLFSSFLSLFIGPIGGITHGVNQFKTIIAYSSILHVGYLLLGLVSNYFCEAVYLNIFQYLFIYGLNTFQFLLAFVFIQSFFKKRDLNLNMPLIFFFFLISIFSFIGLPPFAGFYAKLNIIINCYNTNNILLQIIAIIFILFSTLIAAFLYLKFINYLYFFNSSLSTSTTSSFSPYNFFSAYLLSFLTIIITIYPIIYAYISPIYEILSL